MVAWPRITWAFPRSARWPTQGREPCRTRPSWSRNGNGMKWCGKRGRRSLSSMTSTSSLRELWWSLGEILELLVCNDGVGKCNLHQNGGLIICLIFLAFFGWLLYWLRPCPFWSCWMGTTSHWGSAGWHSGSVGSHRSQNTNPKNRVVCHWSEDPNIRWFIGFGATPTWPWSLRASKEFYSPDLNLVTTIPEFFAPPRLSVLAVTVTGSNGRCYPKMFWSLLRSSIEALWALSISMRGALGEHQAETCGARGSQQIHSDSGSLGCHRQCHCTVEAYLFVAFMIIDAEFLMVFECFLLVSPWTAGFFFLIFGCLLAPRSSVLVHGYCCHWGPLDRELWAPGGTQWHPELQRQGILTAGCWA